MTESRNEKSNEVKLSYMSQSINAQRDEDEKRNDSNQGSAVTPKSSIKHASSLQSNRFRRQFAFN